jgi:CheY-like chemotaxis protein
MGRILVVDDDAQVRQFLRAALEGAQHQVAEAADGAAALRLCAREPIDLLLCDLFMPGKDGLATMLELHRDWPDVKVVAISGGGFDGTMDMLPMAERLGAFKVLHKPVSVPALLEAVDEALRPGRPAAHAATADRPDAI